MQFCVTRVILRDLAALVPQIFHSLHKITHFLTGYINSYKNDRKRAKNLIQISQVFDIPKWIFYFWAGHFKNLMKIMEINAKMLLKF
jgi:hypothetical protein